MLETFTEFLQSIFGVYTPCYTVLSDNTIQASPDFGYLASVVVFCIVLWFLLKTIGGLIYEWLR